MTAIDGIGIHFIHVSSRHENAPPLVISHGWPGYTEYVAQGGDWGNAVNSGVSSARLYWESHLAWEQPQIFSEEMRATFRSVR
jgi:hypothetical protein